MAQDKSQPGENATEVPQVQQEPGPVFDDDSMFNAADPQADVLSPEKGGSAKKPSRVRSKRRKAA
jgi:hypothetical protein